MVDPEFHGVGDCPAHGRPQALATPSLWFHAPFCVIPDTAFVDAWLRKCFDRLQIEYVDESHDARLGPEDVDRFVTATSARDGLAAERF